MEEKYIELLAKTDYNALTSDEKELIKELCANQSEFEQAKQLMSELSALDPEPHLFDSSKVKKRLDEEFKEVYTSKEGGGWINFLFPPIKPILNRPGIQLAMVLVLFLGSYLILELMDFNNAQSVQLAKNENKLSDENEEEAIDLKIDENSMLDEKNLDDYGPENSERTAELIVAPEVEFLEAPQETALVIDQLISEESIIGGTIHEDSRTLAFEDLRSDLVEAEDAGLETTQFLIPTVQDDPELLEGLFVTF